MIKSKKQAIRITTNAAKRNPKICTYGMNYMPRAVRRFVKDDFSLLADIREKAAANVKLKR